MTIDKDTLEKTLQQKFPAADLIEIHDMAGDNDHWSVKIVDKQFANMSLINQHKCVQQALSDYDIHALAIKTLSIL